MGMFLFFSLLLGGCFDGSEYTSFQGINYNEETKKYTRDLLVWYNGYTIRFLIDVLERNGEDFYLENNQVFITKKLWKDKEKLWNYWHEVGELVMEENDKEPFCGKSPFENGYSDTDYLEAGED
jgi:hypothetical protein